MTNWFVEEHESTEIDGDNPFALYRETDSRREPRTERRSERSAPEVPSTLLPVYLREMGRTPLINHLVSMFDQVNILVRLAASSQAVFG